MGLKCSPSPCLLSNPVPRTTAAQMEHLFTVRSQAHLPQFWKRSLDSWGSGRSADCRRAPWLTVGGRGSFGT